MVKKRWWCAFLSVLFLVMGAGSVRAVEYGEMVQKDGKWVFKSTEDPVFKLMRTQGLIDGRGILQSFTHKREKTGSNPPMRFSSTKGS